MSDETQEPQTGYRLFNINLAGHSSHLPPNGQLVAFDDDGMSEVVNHEVAMATVTIPGFMLHTDPNVAPGDPIPDLTTGADDSGEGEGGSSDGGDGGDGGDAEPTDAAAETSEPDLSDVLLDGTVVTEQPGETGGDAEPTDAETSGDATPNENQEATTPSESEDTPSNPGDDSDAKTSKRKNRNEGA